MDVTLNYDGIGSPSAKRTGYRRLSTERLFDGFSLFYKLDDRPHAALGVRSWIRSRAT